jgi:hypothetical protein
VPVQVHGLTGATAVASAGYTAWAIASDGTPVGWGSNAQGQLGIGNTASQGLPVPMVGITHAIGLASGGVGQGTAGSIGLVIAG